MQHQTIKWQLLLRCLKDVQMIRFYSCFPTKIYRTQRCKARFNSTVMSEGIGNKYVVNAKTKEKVEVKSFWKDSDVVICFLRRFGCPVCRWIAKETSSLQPTFNEHNVKLVGIGPEAFGVEEFLQLNCFSGETYIDEKRESYTALNFGRTSFLGAVGSALEKGVRELAANAKADGLGGNVKGDIKQLGGLLVVRKGGETLMNFKQTKASDYVKNSEILQALGISKEVADSHEEVPSCADI